MRGSSALRWAAAVAACAGGAACNSPLGPRSTDAAPPIDSALPVPDSAASPDADLTPEPFDMRLPGDGRLGYEVVAVLSSEKVLHLVWRNGGYRREVPIVDGYPDWTDTGPWQVDNDLPGSGPIDCRGGYLVVGSHFGEGIWRDGQGWARDVPLLSGGPDFASADWGTPFPENDLPGQGAMRAQYGYRGAGNVLHQEYWRGDQGFRRTVPPEVDSPDPDFGNADPWQERFLDELPGSGRVHAQTSEILPAAGVLMERIWRDDVGWQRFVPLVSDQPDYGAATDWLELSY